MSPPLKTLLRRGAMRLCSWLGSPVHDCRTGEYLGRALLLPWGGKIHLLGAHCELWIPVPLPQKSLVYWRQEVGFTRHQPEEILRREPALSLLKQSPWTKSPPKPLLVYLDHRSPSEVTKSLARWFDAGFTPESTFLAYGGPEENLAAIEHPNKAYISDPRLRTRQHIREKQSYRGIFSTVADWLKNRDFTHLLLVEFDQIPLMQDVGSAYLRALRERDADVVGCELRRMDQTIHPHWLGAVGATFPNTPVWSMLGTGQFWKREAWEAVSADTRHADWYLELDLPTTAYELGFRLARLSEQEPFIRDLPGNLSHTPEKARAAGAWTLHPVKTCAPTTAPK